MTETSKSFPRTELVKVIFAAAADLHVDPEGGVIDALLDAVDLSPEELDEVQRWGESQAEDAGRNKIRAELRANVHEMYKSVPAAFRTEPGDPENSRWVSYEQVLDDEEAQAGFTDAATEELRDWMQRPAALRDCPVVRDRFAAILWRSRRSSASKRWGNIGEIREPAGHNGPPGSLRFCRSAGVGGGI
jgi:hypothetical protein